VDVVISCDVKLKRRSEGQLLLGDGVEVNFLTREEGDELDQTRGLGSLLLRTKSRQLVDTICFGSTTGHNKNKKEEKRKKKEEERIRSQSFNPFRRLQIPPSLLLLINFSFQLPSTSGSTRASFLMQLMLNPCKKESC
jgi:hypothetical protein